MVKYLLNGQEVEIVEKTSKGYLVNFIYESENGNEPWQDDDIHFVENVYEVIPVHRYKKQIQNLEDKINGLSEKKRELEKQISVIEQSNKDLFDRFSKYEQLNHLKDFIDRKITHWVDTNWGGQVSIHTINVKEDYDDRDRDEFKLLSLFGNTKGDLLWKVNQYKDGSGSWYTAIPCMSYDDAIIAAQKLLDEYINNKDNKYSHYVIDSAKKYNLKLDEKYITEYEKEQKESRDNRISELIKEIEKLKEEE